MIMRIFAVKDKKMEAFLQPFFSINMATALRSLSEVVKDANHTFAKHSEDYVLYELGTFDDATGRITGNPDGADSILNLGDLKT